MTKTRYPLLYVILAICIYAVIADTEINRKAKIIVITILALFFPSVDIYVYARRKRGIPDDFKYSSSDDDDEEEGEEEVEDGDQKDDETESKTIKA
ncbi:uncharacterized protein V2V93DRAFT_127884 [Kockiozyma suomiensis]|uniref:uncharacterized protein n=1 Tax=Kockiozyma suomiensis TaxID=1337062 RepID=UPI0033442B36